MDFLATTTYHIALIGVQTKPASLMMDQNGNFISILEIALQPPLCSNIKHYEIIAFDEDAIKIRKYGFLGLPLKIEGAPHPVESSKIIANKLIFLNLPNSIDENRCVDQYFSSGKITYQ